MLHAWKLRFWEQCIGRATEAVERQGHNELTFWQAFVILRGMGQATKDAERVFSLARLYC